MSHYSNEYELDHRIFPPPLNHRALLVDAYKLAAASPDSSTGIGAFLVKFDGQVEWLTQEWNHPPHGWKMSNTDWDRPMKYSLVEHAERNSLYKAALYGISTAGATMVASWAACAECARAIVQAGIHTLVRHYPPVDSATERWLESVSIGDRILKAGGVRLVDVFGPIHGAPPILRSGELYDPSA